MKSEPVLTSALLVAVVTSFLAMAQALGWIHLTDEQSTACFAFIGALAAVLGIIVRQFVTPWPLSDKIRKLIK